jgi:hypothetical protein
MAVLFQPVAGVARRRQTSGIRRKATRALHLKLLNSGEFSYKLTLTIFPTP